MMNVYIISIEEIFNLKPASGTGSARPLKNYGANRLSTKQKEINLLPVADPGFDLRV